MCENGKGIRGDMGIALLISRLLSARSSQNLGKIGLYAYVPEQCFLNFHVQTNHWGLVEM